MKKTIIGKLMLLIGAAAFLLPLLLGIYKITAESWQYGDWLVMYSFLYWPTYLIGGILIGVGIILMKKHR